MAKKIQFRESMLAANNSIPKTGKVHGPSYIQVFHVNQVAKNTLTELRLILTMGKHKYRRLSISPNLSSKK